jgi:hypothetical protein
MPKQFEQRGNFMKSTGYAAALKSFVCACILLLSASTVQAAGIAFVTNVKGEPKADSAKLSLMFELNRGQRIACTAECTVGVMYLQSGKEFVIKGPGEYLIGDNEVTAKIGVPPTIRDTAWRVSSQTVLQMAQTSSASVRMREIKVKPTDKPAADRLVYPVQTKISSLNPVFQWESGKTKGPFEFELLTPGTDKPLYKARVNAGMMKLPASVKLLPDTEYRWTVVSDGSVLGTGSFNTLSSASLELARQRAPQDKANFSDRLLYALTLHELGATQDAQEILGKLSRERPDLPELATMGK